MCCVYSCVVAGFEVKVWSCLPQPRALGELFIHHSHYTNIMYSAIYVCVVLLLTVYTVYSIV